ncbi:adenylosuccinate lyase [Winogradskyella immobilis]|uniref:Adenylosuccinate lyase n=1 Tax=Winogradskyella immobilis TaxID=2816852 RepID=A0ABS8EK52_9FLAO|nr:adenylosuccinate lyase [Winogradskyella immobilis]MCC1483593.1 adenylosuccinate lyase [Winogradskyella immobilis]MCG0015687.1 adenylosuccinate lyase [Winogradskyella immobilis]
MTKDQLYKELDYVNHSREKRIHYANLVINNPELIAPLLEILFTVDDKISCRAAWVFEFMCSKQIEEVLPYLDTFTENMGRVYLDSAVRPIAKVSELISKSYSSKTDNQIKQLLTSVHIERIVEACFDWMISNQKVAVKAYSMQTLYLLGKSIDWIHPELLIILERDFSSQSAAFRARARHIIGLLKKEKSK